ncbi:hypothetical protein EsH8_III_001195 [Colletotrichum jinshuiense]
MTVLRRSGGSPQDAIVIDDDEPAYSAEDRQVVDLERRIHQYRPRDRNHSLGTDISSLDVQDEDAVASEEVADIIDLTVDDDSIFVLLSQIRRSEPRPKGIQRQHEKIKVNGKFWIKLNKLYELDTDQGPNSVTEVYFILVTAITEDTQTHQYTVRGLPFTRSRKLLAKLPRKLNEIFAMYELTEGDYRTPEQQSSIEVTPAALLRPRTLHLTNAPFPDHRYDSWAFANRDAVEKEGPLVCRWKYFVHYENAQKKKLRKAHRCSLERIREHEVKREEFRVPEEILRQDWRGETTRGGSHIPEGRALAAGEPPSKQLYTVFDSFCGAGGFSRGAERAGLSVKYAVDHWDKACNTYRLNFPDTQLFELSIDELLLTQENVNMRADILHLSPPCQTWSPAHTVAGANDEANIAALFACRSLVEKVRPRVFTLEQTFGLTKACHRPFFCSLIGGFTEFGYSVAWKVVSLQNWGLPQKRERLIMIGACPGEKLPPFPAETHSENGSGGLSKHVTIRQALAKIKETSTFHNPQEEMKDNIPLGSVASNPDQILRRCMTCSGGQNIHWSKTRGYTIREFASLQGFPVWHQFAEAPKSALKKQIGNAFPASVVRLLCEHLKNWLLVEDGIAPPTNLRSSVGGRELILVSEGPRVEIPPAVMQRLPDLGGSPNDAIMLDEGDQVEIKFYEDSDIEMNDAPGIPDSLWSRSRSRSVTMSLGGTPEPVQAWGFKEAPIVLD